MLIIGAIQQDTDVAPRMAMQSAIIIRAQEEMQINVEKAVAGDNPSAEQVRVFFAADDEIGVPRRHDLFGEAEQGAEEEAWEFHLLLSLLITCPPFVIALFAEAYFLFRQRFAAAFAFRRVTHHFTRPSSASLMSCNA